MRIVTYMLPEVNDNVYCPKTHRYYEITYVNLEGCFDFYYEEMACGYLILSIVGGIKKSKKEIYAKINSNLRWDDINHYWVYTGR